MHVYYTVVCHIFANICVFIPVDKYIYCPMLSLKYFKPPTVNITLDLCHRSYRQPSFVNARNGYKVNKIKSIPRLGLHSTEVLNRLSIIVSTNRLLGIKCVFFYGFI